ncbi:MAG: 7TM diverse intracellular signaling domain-containing protein [Bacteroidota bacterium]|nr:7TM diverse intracellular signaling domain-containing protein [Bacteroidota bacterium]
MKKTFYLIGLFLFSLFGNAYNEYITSDNKKIAIFNEKWFEDTSKQILPEQALINSNQWKDAVIGTAFSGEKPSVYWLRFNVLNETGAPLILNRNINVKSTEFFEVVSRDSIIKLPNIAENTLWNFKLGIHEYTSISNYAPEKLFLMRVETFHRSYIGLEIFSVLDFFRLRYWNYVFLSVFIGICLVMIFYNFLIGLLSNSAINIYFGAYVSFLLWYVLTVYNIIPSNLGGSKYFYLSYFIPYSLTTITLLLFAQNYLNLKTENPLIYKITLGFILTKVLTFFSLIIGLTYELIFTSIIDFIMILTVFVFVFYIYFKKPNNRKKYVFFLIAFVFIIIHSGFRYIKDLFPSLVEIPIYDFIDSYQFLFTGQMIVLLFTISTFERFRLTYLEKNQMQTQLIEQLKFNDKLRNQINTELEIKVKEKTKTILEQAQKIAEMNDVLQKHNLELETELKVKEENLITNKILTYKEFQKQFESDDSCFEFLSNMKWSGGFKCKRCQNDTFSLRGNQFVRRCKKCSYVESSTYATIFENLRFSINKAFYLVYLSNTGKKIKLEELSDELQTRPQTISDFLRKINNFQNRIPKRKLQQMTWLDIIVASSKDI